MTRFKKENKYYDEWMNPFSCKKELHRAKQKILKLCIESRNREIKYNGGYKGNYYYLNKIITVNKSAVFQWLKNGDLPTLYVHDLDNQYMCGIDMNRITEII